MICTSKGMRTGRSNYNSYYSGNSYTVGTNDPVELQSAVIDRRSDDYYTIYLAPQAGLTDLEQIRQAEGVVTIKAAPQALDGLLVSFAQRKGCRTNTVHRICRQNLRQPG